MMPPERDRVRVLHIIERLPYGGAENLLLVLARNIDRSRFDLSFCCLDGGGPVAETLRAEGFQVVCLEKPRLRHSYRWILELRRLIGAGDIDIVQTHLRTANVWGRLGALFARRPFVCKTEHATQREPWSRGAVRARIRALTDSALDRFTDRVIFVSESQRHGFLGGSQVSFSDSAVVHNAFDERRFPASRSRQDARTALGFSEGDFVVGAVGRLVPHKGHATLLRAAGLASARRAGFKLMIIGDGPERARLESLAADLGLDARILCGRKDVPELLRGMDAFAQPSQRESFGIAVIEAMASGLPVVATEVGGLPEIVQDGKTGLLVPPDDPEALASALCRLAESPALAAALAERGMRAAAARFNGRRYAADLEGMYDSLLKEGRGV